MAKPQENFQISPRFTSLLLAQTIRCCGSVSLKYSLQRADGAVRPRSAQVSCNLSLAAPHRLGEGLFYTSSKTLLLEDILMRRERCRMLSSHLCGPSARDTELLSGCCCVPKILLSSWLSVIYCSHQHNHGHFGLSIPHRRFSK